MPPSAPALAVVAPVAMSFAGFERASWVQDSKGCSTPAVLGRKHRIGFEGQARELRRGRRVAPSPGDIPLGSVGDLRLRTFRLRIFLGWEDDDAMRGAVVEVPDGVRPEVVQRLSALRTGNVSGSVRHAHPEYRCVSDCDVAKAAQFCGVGEWRILPKRPMGRAEVPSGPEGDAMPARQAPGARLPSGGARNVRPMWDG